MTTQPTPTRVTDCPLCGREAVDWEALGAERKAARAAKNARMRAMTGPKPTKPKKESK